MRRWLVLFVIVMTCYQQFVWVVAPMLPTVLEQHQLTVDRTIEAPFLQRVLVVWVADMIAQPTANYLLTVAAVYILIATLSTAFALWASYALFLRFFKPDHALIGLMVYALTYSNTLLYGWGMPPHSYLENALTIGGILWLHTLVSPRSSSSRRSIATPRSFSLRSTSSALGAHFRAGLSSGGRWRSSAHLWRERRSHMQRRGRGKPLHRPVYLERQYALNRRLWCRATDYAVRRACAAGRDRLSTRAAISALPCARVGGVCRRNLCVRGMARNTIMDANTTRDRRVCVSRLC